VNLGSVGIAEVPDHEDIALIAVTVGVPLLVNGDTIDALDGGMLHDDNIVEVHFDIAGSLKGFAEVVEILLFGLCGVDDLIA